MVSETLTSIENWYKEPSSDSRRGILLSKLAMLEFCGWLEGWIDDFIKEIDLASLRDPNWIKTKVIDSNHGFHYRKHLRPMVCSVLGEFFVRNLEIEFEKAYPGELELISSSLGGLWDERCKLAHSDLVAHTAAQLTIKAPSYTKNQYRIILKRLELYRNFVLEAIHK